MTRTAPSFGDGEGDAPADELARPHGLMSLRSFAEMGLADIVGVEVLVVLEGKVRIEEREQLLALRETG